MFWPTHDAQCRQYKERGRLSRWAYYRAGRVGWSRVCPPQHTVAQQHVLLLVQFFGVTPRETLPLAWKRKQQEKRQMEFARGAIREFNPCIPKRNQSQISPAASPEIVHHTGWRSWLFIILLRWKIIIQPILATSVNGWENVPIQMWRTRQ